MIKKAYQHLKDNSDMKFSIEYYHHNNQSEPFLSSMSDVEVVRLECVDGDELIVSVMTPELIVSFGEMDWKVSIGEDYVVFSSKEDNETHCIINFC